MLDYREYYREFNAIADKNNWRPLHSPRNLATAVLQEAAELNAEFQWMTDEQSHQVSTQVKGRIGAEVADVALYLFALCEALGLDLDAEIQRKQSILTARS